MYIGGLDQQEDEEGVKAVRRSGGREDIQEELTGKMKNKNQEEE